MDLVPEYQRSDDADATIPVGPGPLPYPRPGWALWAAWAGTTALGAVLGLALFRVIPWFPIRLQGAGYLETALVVLAQALFQWFILRRYLPRLTLQEWVGFVALGLVLAIIVSWAWSLLLLLVNPPQPFTGGIPPAPPSETTQAVIWILQALRAAIVSGIVGAAQWLLLRERVRRPSLWITARAIAALVSYAVGLLFAYLVEPPIFQTIFSSGGQSTNVVNLATLVVSLTGAVFGGLVTGAITGIALVLILRQPPLSGSEIDERSWLTNNVRARLAHLGGQRSV